MSVMLLSSSTAKAGSRGVIQIQAGNTRALNCQQLFFFKMWGFCNNNNSSNNNSSCRVFVCWLLWISISQLKQKNWKNTSLLLTKYLLKYKFKENLTNNELHMNTSYS